MIRLPALAALLAAALPAAAQTDAGRIPDDAPAWKPMAEAIADAQATDRLLVVHTYAVWCGWCARMDRETYTDDAVQDYLGAHYAATRIDLESDQEVPFFQHTLSMRTLGDLLQVSSTPTTVFVDSDGSLITKMPGFQDAQTFLYALRYVREEAYETTSFPDFIQAQEAAADVQEAAPGRD